MGEQVAARFPWGYSSVGRAPALQAGGQGFESLYLHDSHEQCLDIRSGTMQACLHSGKSEWTDSAKHVMKSHCGYQEAIG